MLLSWSISLLFYHLLKVRYSVEEGEGFHSVESHGPDERRPRQYSILVISIMCHQVLLYMIIYSAKATSTRHVRHDSFSSSSTEVTEVQWK